MIEGAINKCSSTARVIQTQTRAFNGHFSGKPRFTISSREHNHQTDSGVVLFHAKTDVYQTSLCKCIIWSLWDGDAV